MEHIRWIPTPPCKLWKLQPKPHDVDPKEDLWKMGGVMCKTHERWKSGWDDLQMHFCNHPSHLPWVLLWSTSCDSDWSFHSFHGGVGFHLIHSLTNISKSPLFCDSLIRPHALPQIQSSVLLPIATICHIRDKITYCQRSSSRRVSFFSSRYHRQSHGWIPPPTATAAMA
jgi:hypothetical protein